MPNYHELKMNAIDSLKEGLAFLGNGREDEIPDIIHKVTENCIPVYYHEVMQVACSKLELACVKTDT